MYRLECHRIRERLRPIVFAAKLKHENVHSSYMACSQSEIRAIGEDLEE
jgi:hypothetical protein